MWDFLPVEMLLELKAAGNYGLAPGQWRRTLQQIRELPERKAA